MCNGNSLANANGFANDIAKVSFSLRNLIPCEWTFAKEFASDCECDGLVHSESEQVVGVPQEGHRGLEQIRANKRKSQQIRVEGADLEIFGVVLELLRVI